MGEILITTTSILQGYKVEKYLGLVTSRLTIGTDLFSDFFANITDVFGGNSRVYEKELKELNNRCIDMIKTEVKNLNGNAAIGVTIDYDEITGKGKQMFLITVTGTAVIVKNETEIKTEADINNLLDEYEVLGEIRDLRLKTIKINRNLESINIDNLNINEKLKIVEFYKITDQFEKAEEILSNIYENNVIVEIKYKLFEIYIESGQYSKAEDLLYELIEFSKEYETKKYSNIVNLGIKFYKDLLVKDEDDLKRGNLPKNEVYDGLRELEKKLL